MNALAFKSNYQLQLPSNFVDIDSEEMEYVDGGGVYVSNYQLRNILISVGLNPIGATVLGLTYWKAVSVISATFSLICAKFGSLGGPIGAVAGYVFGALTLGSIAVSIADAIYEGKGLEFDFTWRPVINVK